MTSDKILEQLEYLPDYLGHHLALTLSALALSVVICLPLAILVTRIRFLQWPTLAFASVTQTIPGIALLAVMVILLGKIGFVPALIALFLYSMLPILRNTVTGITGVEPSLVEAAYGVGMTPNQVLRKVELPLALPVIIAGIRTSAVWVVGTATLSTPVGATSLGNYIFSGLQTQNSSAVLVGCLSAVILAITIDQLIHLVQIASLRRKLLPALVAGIGFVVLVVGAIYPIVAKSNSQSMRGHIVIGAKPFTEQYILSQLIADVLNDAGFDAEIKSSLGSAILFNALAEGEIDVYVDYSGTIWTNIMKRTEIPSADEVLSQMTAWLLENHGIVSLGALGFENAYALALPRGIAESLKITTLADLAPHTSSMVMGADYVFFDRPEWKNARDAYRLNFKELRVFDPTLMYTAVRVGEVDVISAYSTDGRNVEYDLLVLEDPLQSLPPYDAALLLSPKIIGTPGLESSLMALIGEIDDDMMRKANKTVDSDGLSVRKAAAMLRAEALQGHKK